MRPVIGIIPDYTEERKRLELYSNYVASVEDAGGIPLVLPVPSGEETAEYFTKLCDGFIFSGGIDIEPKTYGEKPSPKLGEVSPSRDEADFQYFKSVYAAGKPIFGICRGAQVLNVCRGGTLYQDLNSEYPADILNHSQTESGEIKTHTVFADSDSVAAKAYGSTEFAVNSFHHQAVKDVAPGFTVTAKASDGVIEALEDKSYGFFILVQWHPEKMYSACGGSRKLFRLFVDACK